MANLYDAVECPACHHLWAYHGSVGCIAYIGEEDACWCQNTSPAPPPLPPPGLPPVERGREECQGNWHVMVGLGAGCACGEVVKR